MEINFWDIPATWDARTHTWEGKNAVSRFSVVCCRSTKIYLYYIWEIYMKNESFARYFSSLSGTTPCARELETLRWYNFRPKPCNNTTALTIAEFLSTCLLRRLEDLHTASQAHSFACTMNQRVSARLGEPKKSVEKHCEIETGEERRQRSMIHASWQ